MTRMLWGALALGVALSAWGAAAKAQEGDDARARTHFEAGRLHFEEGAYDRAHDEFLRAWELSQRPALLINLATVEERLALYGQAAERLSSYLSLVPDDPNADRLRRRIANLQRLEAQREAESAQGGGAGGAGTEGTGAEGGGTEGGATETATTPPASGGGGGDGLVVGGIVGLAVGGVGFVLQGVFGGLALSEDAALADGCGATRSCTEDDVADANTFAAVSDAMMVVGIVGVAAGATLLVLGLLSDGGDDTAAVVPYVDPNGGGLTARAQF